MYSSLSIPPIKMILNIKRKNKFIDEEGKNIYNFYGNFERSVLVWRNRYRLLLMDLLELGKVLLREWLQKNLI